MNKILLLITSVVCFALSLNIALASANLSMPSSVNFGDVDWDIRSALTFTIVNTGDINLTNINLSSTASSKYNLTISPKTFDLSAGSSKIITLSVFLDKEDQSVVYGRNITIGNIIAKSNGFTSQNMPVYLTNDRLKIRDLDIRVGKESDTNLVNGETIAKKAEAKTEITFYVELENLFDSDDDKYSIEDATVKVTIEEIDDGDDIEEETEKFTINAGEKKTETVTLTVPEIVKGDTYNVIISVEGDNSEDNHDYSIEWRLKLDVEKKKNDIQIRKAELIPSSVLCSQLKTTIDVELFNLGRDEESEVAFDVKNSDLNINERFTNIKLGKDYDDDARYRKEIPIVLDENLAKKGIFPLIVSVYFDNDKLDDQKTVNLEIKGCGNENQEQQNETVVIPNNETDEQDILEEEGVANDTEEGSLQDIDVKTNMPYPVTRLSSKNISVSQYYNMIIGLIILVGIIILLSVVIFIKKYKRI